MVATKPTLAIRRTMLRSPTRNKNLKAGMRNSRNNKVAQKHELGDDPAGLSDPYHQNSTFSRTPKSEATRLRALGFRVQRLEFRVYCLGDSLNPKTLNPQPGDACWGKPRTGLGSQACTAHFV